MKTLAIITARGGSKRIPRKNIKDFLGAPIISYPIKACLESGIFDEVMVSTDDEEIAEISSSLGANVPFKRSAKNSDDFSTTFDVLAEVLRKYEENNIDPQNICCLYPTAPFITKDILKNSFKQFTDGGFDSLLPVVEYEFAPQRALNVKDGKIFWQDPAHALTRSQDLENLYHDTGQFYWLKSETIKVQKKIITDNTGFIKLDPLYVQDIDTAMDWKLAELKYKLQNQGYHNEVSI